MARSIKTVAAFLCAALPLSSSQAQQTDCSELLRQAFNTALHTSQAENSSSYKAWQCATSFNTHDEARNAGLDIGAVIYGVPITIGGTFDSTEVSIWKSANCSSEQKAASSANATFEFVRTLTPEAAALVAKCFPDGEALACGLSATGNTAVFTAAWNRANGERANAAPVIQNLSVTGGTCKPNVKRGGRLVEGGTPIICAMKPEQDFVIALATDRGACFETTSNRSAPQLITGKVVLTQNTTFQAPIIEISPGARVVTNGYQLTLVAERELRIKGNSSFVSFTQEDSSVGRGLHGRSGAPIVIQAAKITGDQLTIQNFGEDGKKGGTGPQGPQGDPGAGNWWGRHGGLKFGCGGARTSGNGRAGFPGLSGGNGGDGGPILLSIRSGLTNGALSRILVDTKKTLPDGSARTCSGSCGGFHGAGGDGGPGGPPGPSGAGTGGCGGGGTGNSGPQGPRGPDGNDGRDVPVSRL